MTTPFGRTVLDVGPIAPYGQGYHKRFIPSLASLFVPLQGTSSTNTAGGTVLAGTYTYAVSYVYANGESAASPTNTQVTTGSTSTLTINSPAAHAGATGWYAYVSQVNGVTLTRQQAAGTPTAIGTALTLTAPPTSTGASPGGANGQYTYTVPGGEIWIPMSHHVTLTTSALAGNRLATLSVKDPDGNILYTAQSTYGQATGTTNEYTWLGAGGSTLTAFSSGSIFPSSPQPLRGGDVVTSTIVGWLAGDTLTQGYVEVFVMRDGPLEYETGRARETGPPGPSNDLPPDPSILYPTGQSMVGNWQRHLGKPNTHD